MKNELIRNLSRITRAPSAAEPGVLERRRLTSRGDEGDFRWPDVPMPYGVRALFIPMPGLSVFPRSCARLTGSNT